MFVPAGSLRPLLAVCQFFPVVLITFCEQQKRSVFHHKVQRRMTNTVSLPILLGTKPAKFKVAPQYFEVKPLLMINSRLPDKKIDLPIVNKKDDKWRTDDIYMNMLHLKLEKRRQNKLDQMSYIMKDLKSKWTTVNKYFSTGFSL